MHMLIRVHVHKQNTKFQACFDVDYLEYISGS